MTGFVACADDDGARGGGGDPADPVQGVVALDRDMNKLGPELQVMRLGTKRGLVRDVQTRETASGSAIRAMISMRPNHQLSLDQYGASDVKQYGGVYTAFIPIDRLMDVASEPGVRYIRAARKLDLHVDVSVGTSSPGIGLSAPSGGDWGTGVVAGVVDTGLYEDHPDFTDGSTSRVVDTWAQYSGPDPYAGSFGMADSPGSAYTNNAGSTVKMAADLDLNGLTGCTLSFVHKHYIETGYDRMLIEVQPGGSGPWTALTSFTGYQLSWTTESISLAAYENDDLGVRFIFESDAFVTDLGWFGDNVSVDCTTPSATNVFFDDFESGFNKWSATGMSSWGLFGPSSGGSIQDFDGHGTNVTAIMAGKGVAPTGYDGVARDADIMVVGTTLWDPDIVDGVEYIFNSAGSQPAVVNLSLGSGAGPHDGRGELSTALDALSGPGRVIVTSAGNSGDVALHVDGVVNSTSFESIQYDHNSSLAAFDIWHDSEVGIDVRVRRSDMTTTPTVAPGFMYSDSVILIINYAPDPTQPTNLIYVQTDGDTANWQIQMAKSNGADPDAAFDGWNFCCGNSAMDNGGDNDPDTASTIGEPATAYNTLSVAAYVTKDFCASDDICLGDVGDLAFFSSRGPTADDRTLDITAPGSFIRAACSPYDPYCSGDPGYVYYAGTSQASPHAAGLAVLALQQNANLGVEGIRSLMAETADTSSTTTPAIGSTPSDDWGWGKVRGDTLVAAAAANDPSISSTVTVGPSAPGVGSTLTARGGGFLTSRNGSAQQRYAFQWQRMTGGLWQNIPFAHYQSISSDQFSSGDTLRVVVTPVEYLSNGFHGGSHDWFFGAAQVSGSISIGGSSAARGYTAGEEWQMVSVPTGDITAAGFLTNPLYEWDETTQTYAVATTIVNGRGYFTWIEPTEGEMSSSGASPGTSDVAVALSYTAAPGKPGRHLVGNPFPFPIYWQNLLADGESVETSSKLQNYYYGNYSNGDTQYHVYQVGHLDGKIPPWTAFWVTTFEPVTLTIPYDQTPPRALARDTDVSYHANSEPDPITEPAPLKPEEPVISPPDPLRHPMIPEPAPLVDWEVQIHAVSGAKRDDFNFVGMARGADDGWDKLDVYDPGTLGDSYVVVAVNRDDRKFRPGRYCRDVQLMRRRASWPVEVSTKGLSDDVTLVWGDVPAGWELELVDEVDGVTVNMTESGSYSFTPSKGTGLRRFTVNAVRVD